MRVSRYYLVLAGVLIAVALWFVLHRTADSRNAAMRHDQSERQRTETKPSSSANTNNANTNNDAPPHAPAHVSEQRSALTSPLSDADLLARQHQAYDAIEAAAITYDAKSLPLIEPYLSDPDRLIRDAAVQGMITNGDASAAAYLRAAATKTPDPREAAAMLDAADYVELPSASLLRKNPPSAPDASPPPPASKPPSPPSANQTPSIPE